MNQELSADTTLSHYRIVSKLGAGGMGEVYLAHDTKLDRKVALKILPIAVASHRNRMERFLREAKAAAALNHPNIAQIHEIGEDNGTHFIVMEFIDGVTLNQKIHGEKTELPKLLKYLQQAAEGLSKAHAVGIVHRDLKPDNIMITRDDFAKVLDFGLAKLSEPRAVVTGSVDTQAATRVNIDTAPGVVMGTVGYMSPEQAQGKTDEIDQRSDIFSFGCILFEAVTGHRAFDGKDTIDSLNKIIREPPPAISDFRPDLPTHLQRIVRRCLAKDREDRYQTIKDVGIELRELRRELEGSEIDSTIPFARSEAGGRTSDTGATQKISAAVSTSPAPSSAHIVSRIKQHKLAVLGAAVVVFAFAAFALTSYVRGRNAGVAIDSIAVLPFENRSVDAETEYLSDGLAESLIYRLSQLPNLRVTPTSVAFRYKGKEADAAKAGNELGVSAVLVGRIIQRGDNLTISAELVDVRYNKLLWGEQYDRKMSDLLVTQREIAREIVDKLRLKVSGEEKGLAKHYTESNEAYQLYLRGRFYWSKRTEEGMRRSIEYYQQSIEKDPNFALAYSGLADAYDLLGAPDATGAMPADEAMPKAKAAALKALEIDDTLAEPHVSLAHQKYYYEHDFATAEREYKRAIELNPTYPTAPHWYAVYLSAVGRFDEAMAQVRRAQELDPLSLPINMTVGWVFLSARQNDQSVEQLRKTLEMDPNFVLAHHRLGLAYEQQGKYDDAIAEFKQVINLTSGKPLGLLALAHAYAMSGRRAEALKILADLQEQSKVRFVSPASIAMIYAALGDKEQAFAWLGKAEKTHDGIIVRLKVDSRYDSLRSDPRFTDLVRRVGLQQ
jgi:eukaryotic-like serine/threonine-protein kinase